MERTSGDFLYIHFVSTKRRPPIATTNIICISFVFLFFTITFSVLKYLIFTRAELIIFLILIYGLLQDVAE